MTIQALGLITILSIMFTALIKEWFPAEVTVFLALALLILSGIQKPDEALAGFSNPSIHTVANLFIVGAAVSKSGLLDGLVAKLLSAGKKLSKTLFRIMLPVSMISAFLNNTPLVTFLLPPLQNWALLNKLSPSKVLIPLSYAAILGGTITLVGTSTNLLIHGLMIEAGLGGMNMFDFAYFGLPAALVGILFFTTIGYRLLPDREHDTSLFQKENSISSANKADERNIREKIVVALLLFGIVTLSAFQLLSIFKLTLAAAAVLILTRTIDVSDALKAINWRVIILMGSSIGIGNAIESTGLASWLSRLMLQFESSLGALGILVIFYLLAMGMTEVLNNLATAAIMFPIGLSLSESLSLDPTMMALVTAIACSCSFLTPIGYQTNMLVYGPGGYRFSDFFKAGLPLSLLCMALTITLAYIRWM